MTRINVVPVTELSREHLIAEYREITRIPGNLEKSLNRKSKPFSFDEIPSSYTLGKGHVKFFYDKMMFLEKRFDDLVVEMLSRGYTPKYLDCPRFAACGEDFYNDYEPDSKALEINRKRIEERS